MSKIAQLKETQMGYVAEKDIDSVVEENRFQPCLVRCGGARFICSAQDVKHLTEIIKTEGRDYVRDVSLHRMTV